MLSSLKKWVQDVTVDLTPSPGPIRSTSNTSGSTTNYFYSEARQSNPSGIYLSRPISLDSVENVKINSTITSIPPAAPASPVELDLSHLNREEQEHIANVLRRAKAAEEQTNLVSPMALPAIVPTTMSISRSSSSSPSSTSSSSSSTTSEHEPQHEVETNFVIRPKSILMTRCQQCGKEYEEPSSSSLSSSSLLCFECHEKKELSNPFVSTIDADNLSLVTNVISNGEKIVEETRTILSSKSLTEIDENEFFYDEPSPYAAAVAHQSLISPPIEETSRSSYTIDEFVDEDDENDDDEEDHVKILEETIANLSRNLPSNCIDFEPIENSKFLSTKTRETVRSDAILEMHIESPPNETSFVIPIPTINLSRSSGIRENLTDLLSPVAPTSPQSLQRTSSIHDKPIQSFNRHKRHLPSVPHPSDQFQLRRVHSESRFCLPEVPAHSLVSSPIIDDESDLLEINLTQRTFRSKTEPELINSNELKPTEMITNGLESSSSSSAIPELSNHKQQRIKQLRDQTTNTPPMTRLSSSSIKAKKRMKKKSLSPIDPIPSESTTISNAPISSTKLQKSTSTEITYPFSVVKLIINPSRQGIFPELGFRISGGHSSPNCMEVTARIEQIDKRHRNYQVLANTVDEGDEVLEIAGVSLRGKSALFVEDLMNKLHDEFEILIRHQNNGNFGLTDGRTSVENVVSSPQSTGSTTDQQRFSLGTSVLSSLPSNTNSTNQVKSPSISSFHPSTSNPSEIHFNQEMKETPSTSNNIPSPDDSSKISQPTSCPVSKEFSSSNYRRNSNDSDDTDSLSHYFQTTKSRQSSVNTSATSSSTHGRSQSVIPFAHESTMAKARGFQHLLKSDRIQETRASTSIERKSSLSLIPMMFLRKKTKSADFTHQNKILMNTLRDYDYVGDIEIQIGHESEREQLVVRIIQAKNLLAKDANGYSDPFVKVYLLPGRDQENKRRIKYVTKTLNPYWDQTVIYGHMHREEVQYKKLEFTVWDYDRFKANDFLGQVTIDLKNPKVIDDKPHWYRLQGLRSREEVTNRGSSPRLFQTGSADSTAASTTTLNKASVLPTNKSNHQK